MVRDDVNSGLYHMAICNDEAAGIIRFQHEDDVYWPEAKSGEAAYVHRLAVRRKNFWKGGVNGYVEVGYKPCSIQWLSLSTFRLCYRSA
jgi:hypothetical protein